MNHPKGRVKDFFKDLVDARDVHIYGGASLIGWGLWTVDQRLSLVVVGLIFLYLGVYAGKKGP